MEVFCNPPLFVKAEKMEIGEDKLRVSIADRVFSYYRSSLLVYKSKGTEEAGPNDATEALRRGVEEVVAHYPWAAGRLHVDEGNRADAICLKEEDGGGGLQFVSAHASCALAHLGDLADPDPAFEPLFASVDITAPLHARPLIALQVTTFQADGGICVSMNTSHVLFDGVAASIFLQNICSCARGDGLCKPMDMTPRELSFKPASMDPEAQQEGERWTSYLETLFTRHGTASYQSEIVEPLAAARFQFCKEDLERLREEALSKQEDCSVGFSRCSRFDAMAAHLWRARAKTAICRDGQSEESFLLRITVNVRDRTIASGALGNYMGNAGGTAMLSASVQELTRKSLAFAVEKIQEAIKQVTAERFYAELSYLGRKGMSARLLPTCMNISSLVGLGFSEADFGWGKPAYIGYPYEQRRNLVIISEGGTATAGWNVFVGFDSQLELQKFLEALRF